MFMRLHFNRRASLAAIAIAALVPTSIVEAHGSRHREDARTVVDIKMLGQVVVPTGTEFEGTEIGGLSSITYDEHRGVYHALSDDQGNRTDANGDPTGGRSSLAVRLRCSRTGCFQLRTGQLRPPPDLRRAWPRPHAQYVYEVGPWAEPPTIFGVNGIVEVLPIDDAGTMLVMDRW